MLGNKPSVFEEAYPVCDEKALVLDEIEIAVQINSKMKLKTMAISNFNEEYVRENVLTIDKIKNEIADKPIKKIIIVPNRLVNIIV